MLVPCIFGICSETENRLNAFENRFQQFVKCFLLSISIFLEDVRFIGSG